MRRDATPNDPEFRGPEGDTSLGAGRFPPVTVDSGSSIEASGQRRAAHMWTLLSFLVVSMAEDVPESLPLVEVDRDDVVLESSCRVRVTSSVIEDANGDGVIHVLGDDREIVFESTPLRGAPANSAPDAYQGVGIRVEGTRVTIRGAEISGFKVGVRATDCEELVLEDLDLIDNFRQRLGSTPAKEDPADWMFPHDNDDGQWQEKYGAGISVSESHGVTVRRCRARSTQNGLLFDRVRESRVYDNDFSFLSGWGIALWRSCDNVVSRNSTDFCVRGYSHGVYNRGQDSAGILLFEQCSRNVIAENSATHCGDGFFGFAGNEALGKGGKKDCRRLGNNDNLLVRNDFSHSVAHGIEITFSFGNQILANRVAGNAICGVWGGYSRDTLIAGNEFLSNGDAGYGLERGGVNIEHGARNRIHLNRFQDNECGVHLWWDEDPSLKDLPWTRSNGFACEANQILSNSFIEDRVGIHLRSAQDTFVADNQFRDVPKKTLVESSNVVPGSEAPPWSLPVYPVFGDRKAVGLRKHLAGRQHIRMTQWGPEVPHLK